MQEALRREGKAEPLLRDLYEFRLLIEPQAAGLDGRAREAEDLAELGELAARWSGSPTSTSPSRK